MKAIVCTNYGPPEALRLVEAENLIPSDDQVLVKVRASSVNFNTLGFVRGNRSWLAYGRDFLNQNSDSEMTSRGRWKRLAKMSKSFGWVMKCLVIYPNVALVLSPSI